MIGSLAWKNLIQHVLVRSLRCQHRFQHVMTRSLTYKVLYQLARICSITQHLFHHVTIRSFGPHHPFDSNIQPPQTWCTTDHLTSGEVLPTIHYIDHHQDTLWNGWWGCGSQCEAHSSSNFCLAWPDPWHVYLRNSFVYFSIICNLVSFLEKMNTS